MTDIAKLVLQADTRQLKDATRDLKGVSEQGARTAGAVDGMGNSIMATMRRIIGPAAIGGAIAAFGAMTRSAINTADEMTKAAQRIGVGVEELSRLRHAADLSGISFDGLQSSIGILNRNLVDVNGNGNAAQKALAQMGIAARGADGQLKSTTQIMAEMANVFQQMPDGAEKSALAMAVFGRSGAQLIPMLNQGADGIREMTDEADRLGIVIDQETGRAAEQFNDNLDKLQKLVKGAALSIAREMLPAMNLLTESLVQGAGDANEFGRVMNRTALAIGFVSHKIGELASFIRSKLAPAYEYVGKVMQDMGFGGTRIFGGGDSTLDVVNRMKRDMGGARSAVGGVTAAFDELNTASSGGGGRSRSGTSALQKIDREARDAERALQGLARSLESLEDRLDPQGAASRQLQANLALLDEAQRKGLRTAEEIKRTANMLFSAYFGPDAEKAIKTANDNIDAAADEIRKSIADKFNGVKDETRFVADSFAMMADRINSSLQNLSNSIRRGDFLGILGGLVNMFVQLGSVGAFGKGIQGNLTRSPTNASMGANAPAGKPFYVGERGPELFVPGQAGQIRPINDNARVHVTVGIDPRNGNVTAFVNGQIAATAPQIAGAGAAIAQAQMAESGRRRIR